MSLISTLDDYRTVTITDSLSKVTEKFIFGLLYTHLKDKISVNQYGSIKGGSTSHYLISLLDFIGKGLTVPGATVFVIVLDLHSIESTIQDYLRH